MESYSEETLRRVRQNDATLTQLVICYSGEDGGFSSRDADYSQLGAAIAQNTHLADFRLNCITMVKLYMKIFMKV